MHSLHIIEAVAALSLASLLAWRLWQLPKALAGRPDNVNSVTAQALTGAVTPLAQQVANVPWAASLAAQVQAPVAPGSLTAGQYYDPTTTSYPVTLNEFGFITSPSPAPVNPKTNTVPLTNADVCAWVGHLIPTPPSTTCPRCGVAVA